ncbi:lytic transglycosylase domain-containing protein [Paenibacillus sp. D51F]
MSIDPRILTTLLKLQLSPSLSQLTGSSASTASGTSAAGQTSFDQLLSQLAASGQSAWAGEEEDDSYGYGIPASLQPLQTGLPGGLDYMSTAVSGATADGSAAPYDSMIQSAAARYGVSESLIKAVIGAESSFNPSAESSAGAKGLMQLMDGTASGLGVTDSFDPAQNIDGGTKYLSYLLRKYDGSAATALAAYNAGPGKLDRLGISDESSLSALFSNLPAETQRYVAKVLDKESSLRL